MLTALLDAGPLPYGNAPGRTPKFVWSERAEGGYGDPGDMEIGGYLGDRLTGRVIQCIIHIKPSALAFWKACTGEPCSTRLDVALLVNFADDRADFRRFEIPTSSPSSPDLP